MPETRRPRGTRSRKPARRGVRVSEVQRLLLGLPDVTAGFSYGMPSFLLNGRFFARFRDDDTVLVLQLDSIGDRDVLMEMEPRAFFFTDHYRNYPAVLVRLDEAPGALLEDVIREAWRHVAAKPPARPRSRTKRGRPSKPRNPRARR
jgi:hypothetical protein